MEFPRLKRILKDPDEYISNNRLKSFCLVERKTATG